MGASLACAARAAGKREGYLVALADMPYIRRSSIAAVRQALEGGAALVAPYFRARRGHPVGMAGRLYGHPIELGGDRAERNLAAHPRQLVKIPTRDPRVSPHIH